MEGEQRPGPKPKRLYVRVVRLGSPDRADQPAKRVVRSWVENLDRVGRLVAHGELTDPPGDLVVLRASDLAEARRVLRVDPYRDLPNSSYDLLAWNPSTSGSGVNLEPPPARGSGRLTFLQRITVLVRDQRAAIAWYQDVLGMTVRNEDSETAYVELALGRGAAGLSLVAPQPAWGEPYYSEAMGRIGTGTGIAFQTDSVVALEHRLRNAGARITQAPRVEPWGGVSLRFTDVDGNEFLAFQSDSRLHPGMSEPLGSAETVSERAARKSASP
ncbi:MAG: VOC family protein [Thermoplasmata archaeon]|nr:VOC family protein [Thermoplasmata archaeon]